MLIVKRPYCLVCIQTHLRELPKSFEFIANVGFQFFANEFAVFFFILVKRTIVQRKIYGLQLYAAILGRNTALWAYKYGIFLENVFTFQLGVTLATPEGQEKHRWLL